MVNTENKVFWNCILGKSSLKNLINRFMAYGGDIYTAHILNGMQILGFEYSTRQGVSLGIDDLLSSPFKLWIIEDTEYEVYLSHYYFRHGGIHVIERLRHLIETWHTTSEFLKREMSISLNIINILNPVHMMSYSGARGNPSQVHQLVGMRGLMTDPEGSIIELPIQGSLREGLSLTDYIISCYGARKGVVDTAIRTADAGYLTRRLVQIAQHIVVRHLDCGSTDGINLSSIYIAEINFEFALEKRLIGRVIAQPVYLDGRCIAPRNLDISVTLAKQLIDNQMHLILLRSPITCKNPNWICQLCYGWGINQHFLISLGEAVGVIAAQSIGEPGTQLTLRTFHTGGVFTGDINNLIRSPVNGIIYFDLNLCQSTRSRHGRLAWQCREDLNVMIKGKTFIEYVSIPADSLIVVNENQYISAYQVIAEVRFLLSPFKEKVQRYIYTSLEGEVRHTQSALILTNSNELVQTSNNKPTDISHIWVYSGEMEQYTGYRITLVYRSYDYIELNIQLSRQIAKKILYPLTLENVNTESTERSFLLTYLEKIVSGNNSNIGVIQHIPKYQSNAYLNILVISAKNLFAIKADQNIIQNQSSFDFQQYLLNNNKLSNKHEFERFKLEDVHIAISSLDSCGLYYKKYQTYFPFFLGKRQTSVKQTWLNLTYFNIYQMYCQYKHCLFNHLYLSKHQVYYKCNFFFLNEHNVLYKTKTLKNTYGLLYNNILLNYFNYSSFFLKIGVIFWNQQHLNLENEIQESASLIFLSKYSFTFRSCQPFLLTANGIIHVKCFSLIAKGQILITLLYEQLKTSDIIQGLPKAEKLLEARFETELLNKFDHFFVDRFLLYFLNCSCPIDHFKLDGQKNLKIIQTQILNQIQVVYLTQGVRILDKHIEIIIRQMTCKVLILGNRIPKIKSDEGVFDFPVLGLMSIASTHFVYNDNSYSEVQNLYSEFPISTTLWLPAELADKNRIEAFNRILIGLDNVIPYRPLILGMSRTSLYTDSFISEACFEQTSRVLITSALKGRIDWIQGLQENVVFNGLIPAGTGCISVLSTYSIEMNSWNVKFLCLLDKILIFNEEYNIYSFIYVKLISKYNNYIIFQKNIKLLTQVQVAMYYKIRKNNSLRLRLQVKRTVQKQKSIHKRIKNNFNKRLKSIPLPFMIERLIGFFFSKKRNAVKFILIESINSYKLRQQMQQSLAFLHKHTLFVDTKYLLVRYFLVRSKKIMNILSFKNKKKKKFKIYLNTKNLVLYDSISNIERKLVKQVTILRRINRKFFLQKMSKEEYVSNVTLILKGFKDKNKPKMPVLNKATKNK